MQGFCVVGRHETKKVTGRRSQDKNNVQDSSIQRSIAIISQIKAIAIGPISSLLGNKRLAAKKG